MTTSLKHHSKLLIGSAALLLAGVANAQVTVYGLVDLSYGKNELVTGKGSKADFHSGGDDYSSQGNSTTRLGVKASTEVAPGIKANVNFETAGIGADGSVGSSGAIGGASQPFFNRQAWAGLSGSFGEVRLGKQDSVVFQTQAGFDFNGAANAASAFTNAGVAAYAPGRQDRSLQYISPVFSGLKVQAGVQPAGNVVGAKDTVSIGATYTVGALSLGAAAETKRTTTSTSFASLAASYDLSVAKVMASYADGGKLTSGGSGKGVGVGVTAPVVGYNIGLNFGRNSDTKNKAVEAFVNREVFKNTTVYLDLGRAKNGTTNVNYNIYALGAIYAF
ncbi:MAG: porin [Leptothrix sp. (in: b-proteobacteria)]